MKKVFSACAFLIFIISIFFTLAPYALFSRPHPQKARAQTAFSVYARILDENTALYSDPSCSLIKFYLPSTYFVRVISAGETVTKVAYMENAEAPSREGFIKTEKLYAFDGVPEQPYPALKLVFSCEEIIFSDPAPSGPRTVLEGGATALYYGEVQSGGVLYYYVYAGGYVGYVRASAFYPHTLQPSSVPLPEPEPTPDQTQTPSADDNAEKSENSSKGALTAALIIAVSVCSLSAAYLLLRPRNLPARNAAASRDDDFF